jgi:glycosyltransferase involved in cell wall biosynthesis
VCEAYGGGIIDFIYLLTWQLSHHEHVIVHSVRGEDTLVAFDKSVKFIQWPHAQRKISIIKDTKAFLALYKILKKQKADVLHLHSSKAGFIGRLLGPLLSAKIFYTPNGVSFARKDVSQPKRILFIFLEKLASLISGKVICVSSSEQKLFLKIGIKAEVINNGIVIDTEPLISFPYDQIVIVTAGRITNQKNPKLFNEIASAFLDREHVKFVWIGDGELRSILTSANIEIKGWVSKETAKDLTKKSTIYLSTSLWEGLPFAVLDAMKFGKPLVLMDSVGNRDVVRPNRNGFLFKSKGEAVSQLKFLIEHKELWEKFGKYSYDWLVKDFNATKMCVRYGEILFGPTQS